MADLHDALAQGYGRFEYLGEEWDGKSDIKLPTQEWIVFRLNTTIE